MSEFEQFIRDHITSVDHLRVVLLLHGDPAVCWGAPELGVKLRLPPGAAAQALASLEASGILKRGDEEPKYYYSPKSEMIARLVEMMVELDRERPVSLINMIYSNPTDIQAFIDAFKFGKGGGR